MKVHFIEDDADLNKAITFFLKNRKMDYTMSKSGATAVDEILNSNPDVVLLDITLPGKSGYDVLDELRDGGFRKPVIIMTNLDREDMEMDRFKGKNVAAIYHKASTHFDDIVEEILNQAKVSDK